jgi:hypothetical protein
MQDGCCGKQLIASPHDRVDLLQRDGKLPGELRKRLVVLARPQLDADGTAVPLDLQLHLEVCIVDIADGHATLIDGGK